VESLGAEGNLGGGGIHAVWAEPYTEAFSMTELVSDLARPRGRYGVDGDYRLIPAPVVLVGYLMLCLAAVVLAIACLMVGRTLLGVGAAVVAVVLVDAGISVLRFTRRGKFEVWARLLRELRLRGDERVLDLGCGRGAVLLAAAKLVPRGRAVGVDIWRPDQTGNAMQATLANAEAEGVADRVELHTRDMTELPFSGASFDVVVSSLAIHNLPGNTARLSAIDEAVRVLRPGGRIIVADLGFTRLYATRLRQRGMANVTRQDLGWRAWWGLPFLRMHAVTATKPEPTG
jgi:SAM-dependent methyltransferase